MVYSMWGNKKGEQFLHFLTKNAGIRYNRKTGISEGIKEGNKSMKTKENLAVIFVLTAAFLWGCIGIFTRNMNALGFDAMQITALRCLLNACMVGILILATDKGKFRVQKKDIGLFLANGIFSIYIFNFAYNKAITMISLSMAVVLLYTAPVFVMVISVLIFHEKFTAKKGVCLVLCLGGSALVSGLITGIGSVNVPGLLFGLLAGIGYALYSIFTGIIVKKYHPFTNIFYTFLTAGIAAAASCGKMEAVRLFTGSAEGFLWTLGSTVFTSFLPYILYTTALKYMRPSKAAILASIEPVVATLAGIVLYYEMLGLTGFLGIVMVIFAIILANLPEKKKS